MMIVRCDIDGNDDTAYAKAMRWHRNAWLANSDWTQMPDSPLTEAEKQAWAEYRQALRDAPANWTPGPTWDAPDPPG